MTSELEHKIIRLSKDIKLSKNMSFRVNDMTDISFECEICRSPLYPQNVFLIHKNMIFNKGTIHDTEYEIHKFDNNGKYVGKVNKGMLKPTFFSSIHVIKHIE